jgi:hypothetical protein
MQSLFTLLIQLSGKAWAAIVVAVLCGGAVTVYYFSPASPAANSGAVNQPGWVEMEHLGRGGGPENHNGSVPVVPEANSGLVLIPLVAAMLLFSSRRLWPARSDPTPASQKASGQD